MIQSLTFNFSILISFLIGVGIGLTLAVFIYLILVLTTMKQKKFIVQTKVNDVSEAEILKLIEDAKIQFKDEKLRGDTNYFSYGYDISKNLIIAIAKKFYPKSKHPLCEISVDELLMLGAYISRRMDEILDHKGLRFLRKIKVSYVLGLYDVKEDISNNEVIKTTKKYKINEALNAAKKVINVVNPVWWVRKFVMNKAMEIVSKKLCIVLISVVGEETYKIYSKSIYNEEGQIDSNVDLLVSDLEDEVKNQYENLEEDRSNDQIDTNQLLLEHENIEEHKKFSLKKIFNKNLFKRKNKSDDTKLEEE